MDDDRTSAIRLALLGLLSGLLVTVMILALRAAIDQGRTFLLGVGGHSVDREGPAVHLNAGSASLLGRWLTLDGQEERSLLAAGAAAAISARVLA